MSTKYTCDGYSLVPEWDERIPRESRHARFTHHAIDKWDDRSPPESVAPETALDNSEQLIELNTSELTTYNGEPFDSIHLYHGVTSAGTHYTILFCIRDISVVTCLDPEFAQFSRPVRAYLKAFSKEAEVHE